MATPTGNLKPGGTPPRRSQPPRVAKRSGPSTGTLRLVAVLVVVGADLALLKPISNALGHATSNYVTNGIHSVVDPACTTTEVTLSMGERSAVGGDATGHPLVLTNRTGHVCSVTGAPSVRWTRTPSGSFLGHAVAYVGAPQTGAGTRVDILPYQHASVLLTVTNTGKWVHRRVCLCASATLTSR